MQKGFFMGRIGQIAWNKGKTKREYPQMSNSGAKKGTHNSPKTEFKKGNRNTWLGKKRPELIQTGSAKTMFKKGRIWKGTQKEYLALHGRIRKKYRNAILCILADENCKGRFQWSNISQTYKENDPSDWQQLCSYHHWEYDKKFRATLKPIEKDKDT